MFGSVCPSVWVCESYVVHHLVGTELGCAPLMACCQSQCLSVHLQTLYWRGVVDSGTWFARYSKRSNKTQIRYTLKNIECTSRGAFKMIVNVICCYFNRLAICGRPRF